MTATTPIVQSPVVPIAQLLGLRLPLVLASASPRRKALLAQIGFEFSVQPSSVNEEALSTLLAPDEYVKTLALHKAQDIATVQATQNLSSIIIGADTTVVLDGTILNKPADAWEAEQMLKTLSGRTHTVYTGVALVESATKRFLSDACATNVTFRALQDDEIRSYIATGSPLDKAGAYGIQDDFGAVFVERIEGCYYNVVGLPLATLYRRLKEFCHS